MELREAIEQAFDKTEAAPPDPVVDNSSITEHEVSTGDDLSPVEPVASEPSESRFAAEMARDEKGRFAGKSTSTETPAKSVKTATKAPVATEVKTATPAPTQNAPSIAAPEVQQAAAVKPPPSWKALAREEWPKLPLVLREEISRREAETTKALKESADARRNYQAFKETLAPYEPSLRAMGAEPMQAIGQLLHAEATLRNAPTGQKEQMFVKLARDYGVNLEVLDRAFAGEQIPQQHSGIPGEFRDPRVDQLFMTLQQAQQKKQQEILERSQSEIENFRQSHEFFDDLREEMGDLMEVAARRKVAMSLEDAYNRAIQLHPEVASIVQQREAAKRAANPNGSTQRAMAASSSIKAQPASPMMQQDNNADDVRSAVEAAYNASISRR